MVSTSFMSNKLHSFYQVMSSIYGAGVMIITNKELLERNTVRYHLIITHGISKYTVTCVRAIYRRKKRCFGIQEVGPGGRVQY